MQCEQETYTSVLGGCESINVVQRIPRLSVAGSVVSATLESKFVRLGFQCIYLQDAIETIAPIALQVW